MKTEEVKTYWKHRAGKYGALAVGNIGYNKERQDEELRKRKDRLFPVIDFNKLTLDYGCGVGRLSSAFNSLNYFGVDICERLINIAKETNPLYDYQLLENPFIPSDFKLLPNQIITSDVLQHNGDETVNLIFEGFKKISSNLDTIILYEDITKSKDRNHMYFRPVIWYVALVQKYFVVKEMFLEGADKSHCVMKFTIK